MILHSSIKKLKDTAGKNYWQQRVSAELLFLYNLSAAGVGIDTALLMCAAEKLTAALSENGAVTKADVIAAEKALAPLSDVAKSYTAHMVAHAHIDMNWMWGYQETASVTLSTLRTMLDLMKAYPDFTFSQSQASVYEIVEHHDKEMLEEIKERIREGRWEVTAGTWVEHDKNLSGAEAQIRQVTEARKYLSALLDVSPDSLDLDFEPDTFGHPADTVELLTSAGIKYYYHCRGESGHILYRWVGESGESLLVYRDPKWYNDDIDPYILSDMPLKICPLGITDMLNVYGVGDHGGGPTVKDIKAILDMREWPLYPDMVFSSYRGFFGTVEKNAESLPTVRGELNFIFTGCYTSQSEIKKANATLEDRLYDSECAFSLAGICSDRKADGKGFEKAWRAALFNQFHDILPGSGVRETREHALGAFQEALAYVNSEELAAIRAVSDMTDTDGLSDGDAFPLGAGAGYFSAPDRGYLSADAPYGGRVRIVQLF
ncbi:MAG: alpha-mannosidase, partial [Clostridia bacterium]|nr:alpha-mannosidase [Clostridia bacterium]